MESLPTLTYITVLCSREAQKNLSQKKPGLSPGWTLGKGHIGKEISVQINQNQTFIYI